ncbi:MAG: endopeptidase La [Ruminococcaceae bacterium]|nr:endopeptidase La [Oscillospiraceae bacterium]
MNNTPRRGTMPVVVLRDTVLFPHISQQLDMVRSLSIKAVRRAVEAGQEVFITMQKDPSADTPGAEDIYTTGVIASVKQLINHPSSGSLRIRVECLCRATVNAVIDKGGVLIGLVSECTETECTDTKHAQALRRILSDSINRYVQLGDQKQNRQLPELFSSDDDLGSLTDRLSHNIPIPGDRKQKLLAELDHTARCELLISIIDGELQLLELKSEIERRVQENIDKNQKDYYLREQLRVIGEQLGDGDSPAQDADIFREQIEKRDIPEDVAALLLKSCDKLARLPSGSHEASVERNYIEVCLSLPWGITTKDKLDVAAASKKLDRDHYGMERVKERILEFIAVRALAPDIKGQIICLVGPPGVGKTSIARSVAEALGKQYYRISLGGIHDEADIRGHRKTYIGAMPGRIINGLRLAGSMNPLLLLDEIDKLASDFRGDPTSALLEVLDPEQNSTFHDHYVDLPIDLSQVMFITTANDAGRIPGPLMDRMEVIELSSYTHEEKFNIAKRHLLKKQVARHGLNSKTFHITDKAISALIDGYTREAGVRNLEREIASVCRKAAKKIASGEAEKVRIAERELGELLGPARYDKDEPELHPEPGIANGLAWTSVGGTMLEIEVAILEGTGKLELTGSLGDVMQESARTAVSYIRSRAADWGIAPDFHKTKDIHIHVPEGATPKDGPSAGITIATAIISALTGIPARGTVAMTGEITLRGRVLPIGGLREKTMAAMVSGIKTVLIPAKNEPDVSKLSETVRSSLNIIPVSRLDEVLEYALSELPVPTDGGSAAASAERTSYIPRIGGSHEAGESRV